MNAFKGFAAGVMLLGIAASAQAGLLEGKTLDIVNYIGESRFDGNGYVSNTNGSHVVGAGVEWTTYVVSTGQVQRSVDVSDNTILFTFQAPAEGWETFTNYPLFVGLKFTDILGQIDPFASVTIEAFQMPTWSFNETNARVWDENGAFDSSRVAFDEDNISVDLRYTAFTRDSWLKLTIGSRTAEVPEPATLGLLGLGLGAIGVSRRRRRAS